MSNTMDSHSYSSSSSSSSYTTNSSSLYRQEEKKFKPPTTIHSSLHSVRNPLSKPWKKPIAPLPPTPPKIYKVEASNFRDLVQKLTGATYQPQPQPQPQPQSQLRRVQRIAPSPLSISSTPSPGAVLFPPSDPPLSATFMDLMAETLDSKPLRLSEGVGMVGPLGGLSFSPNSSPGWCTNFPLLSPGTLKYLE